MKFSLRFWLYATVALCVGGVARFYLLASVPGEAPSAAANPGKFAPIVAENEVAQAKADIEKRAIAFLKAGDFSALDAMAKEFRTSQFTFANGSQELNLFYQVLNLETSTPDNEWETRLGLLRRWFEVDVESITARVAMSNAVVTYAWHARGIHLAREVKGDAWRIMSERIAEANRILEAARELPEKCPYWYTVWMTKAMLSGEDQQRYDEIFAEALRDFPSYTSIYLMKTFRLQEKWYGSPGEWEAFAKESADRLGGEEGDILYARIFWRVHDFRTYSNPIAESAVDWPRARRGFEAIRRHYPESLLALSEYCSLSGFAPQGARELMRQLFDQLGDRVDLQTWKKVDLFVRDRRWAYSR